MAQTLILAVIFAVMLGLSQFLSHVLFTKKTKHRYKIMSFAAGFSIAYLFLNLLPETYDVFRETRMLIFISLLIGFLVFHLVEKYIYQHLSAKTLVEFRMMHSISFFIYYILVGITLLYLLQLQIRRGILFILPVIFHALVSKRFLSEVHGKVAEENISVKLLLSGSALYGVLLGQLVIFSALVYDIILGLVIGSLLYIITREMLPEKAKGSPLYLLAGIVVFAAVIFVLQFVVNNVF